MTAYYNDFDPQVCDWLEELIRRGHIAQGVVDRRSILDVAPADLRGFTQCHFFAGVGGWSYALRLAGWQDSWPVWTGSPPCQPFSAAGRQLGQNDERHLAPHFAELIASCRPPILFGEQVASSAVFGKAASNAKRPRDGHAALAEWCWLDDLSDRLERAHYAVGASDIPAASVGANHPRQRAFFGAIEYSDPERSGWKRLVDDYGLSCRDLAAHPVSCDAFTQFRVSLAAGRTDVLPIDGLPVGVGRSVIKGFGNAIVPQAAAHFIQVFTQATGALS